MAWKGSMYVGAQHRAGNGRLKVSGATRQVCAEPHGQFTGIDVFIARCCLNRHVDASEAANTKESYRYGTGFGVAAMN